MNMGIIIKDSPIAGKGIFANRNFKKGEVVLAWHPKQLSKEQAEALSNSEKNFVDIVDGKYLYMQPPERYINHSCEPNTSPSDMADIAIQDIQKGEEITSDYGGAGLLTFTCNCGSKNCRGLVT
jgi:SET domain-containing protein